MLLLNSNLNNVAAVQPFVEKATQNIDINQDTFGNILVSLTEAVNNAIRHGNCCEENKQVPDPLAPENIEKDGGRGIFLMRALSDDINFRNNGSTIEMKFRL